MNGIRKYRPARLRKGTVKKAERYVVKHPKSPASQAYLRGLARQSVVGKVRAKILTLGQLSRKLKTWR